MILVTGGTGFVGRSLVSHLVSRSAERVRAPVRRLDAVIAPEAEQVIVGSHLAQTDWRPALEGVTTVVHAAARVHVMRETVSDPMAQFRRTNVHGTLALADQAAAAGVRRFVFLSSIKVNGERTLPGSAFTAADAPAPVDPYGISKMEAEEGLRVIAKHTGMEVAIIRPVLVYGPGAKGNFRSLIRLLERRVPLPFGKIDNRRSLVALDNLIHLIVTCMHHHAAGGRTFLVSDGDDLSTTDLLRRTAAALGKPALLLPVPTRMLRAAGTLFGRGEMVERLVGSLQVDISETRRVLGWAPPVSVDDALRLAVGKQPTNPPRSARSLTVLHR